MIKKLLLSLSFLLLTTVGFGQNLKKIAPFNMRQDIDSLVKYLEEAHPNPYYRYSKERFYKDVQIVKNSLNKPLDQVDFYLAIEPLLGKLEDGHTDLHITQIYNSQNPFILPYNFNLSPNKPFIICSGPYQTVPTRLPAGSQIISINNIDAKKIVNDIIILNTGENRAFRAEFGAARFYFYLEALYKANGLYKIKYRNKGLVKIVTVKGIRKNILDKRITETPNNSINNIPVTEPNYSLKILEKDNTAIINFKSFDWDGYKPFTDSAFTVIKNREIKNLVINLIGDTGGDSDVGDDFLQYILDAPFRQYHKVLEKNSELLKARLKEHRVGKVMDSSDLALLAKTNGSLDTTFYDNIPIKPNPLRFKGAIYLLVNIETYSSASDFAECFKYYKRGMIIGEETGGLVKSYGDIVPARLPHSQLELSVSSKLYYDVGAVENDWKGVVPDIVVSSNNAMTKTLQIIKKAKSDRHNFYKRANSP
jgi:hypothetical protein